MKTPLRDVSAEELLGRRPVRLEEARIRTETEGRVILVTGAAGSIGSELCRQIARFRPAAIVGFDIAESRLCDLQLQMARDFGDVPFHAELGNIQNRGRVKELLDRRCPSAIFHAAAYKHVPLLESHVFEAVENNVFGTWNVADAAERCGVKRFILISSDKAVRPACVMGATKRIAELLVLAMQGGGTQYLAVRFGNVLDSSGSVLPIFRRQLAAGGPLTVTHPEMRRYFMTIPEACQLVLEANTVARPGQICVLDMGEPVRIVELARTLIRLSGLEPDADVRIEFTGIRPGEKLCEELSGTLENTARTGHEKIRVVEGHGSEPSEFASAMESLKQCCAKRDAGAILPLLLRLAPEYRPADSQSASIPAATSGRSSPESGS